MSDQKHPERTDLLDQALAAYGQVDTPPGLEGRILRSIERKSNGRRRVWLLMASAAGVAAAVVALLLIAPRLQEPSASVVSKEDERPVPSEPASAPIRVERPASVPSKPKLHAPSISRGVEAEIADAPRQATFPAPSGVSDQEQLLISLMRSRRQILIAMAQSRPHEIREGIDIAPLESDAAIEK